MNKRHFLNKITCLICFIIISLNWCFGQENHKSENDFRWINFGFGASSYGFSAGGNASLQIKHNLISIRFIYNEELCLLCSHNPPNKIKDLGLMYGYISKENKVLTSISIGISYVENIVRGKQLSCSGGWFSTCKHEMLNHSTIGIPIEAQIFGIGKNVGTGLYGFANLNSESSYIGALLCIRLGKLR